MYSLQKIFGNKTDANNLKRICQLTFKIYHILYSESSKGTFYALLNENRFPMYNDAEEEFDTKLRLENNLNEVAIGYWESEDGSESYYSKVYKLIKI